MSWQAKVFHAARGAFLARLRVHGASMLEAEQRATSITALMLRADPRKLVVRHLVQLATGRSAQ